MPARLLLLDDESASPTERWIERPFLTIGTDPGSDVPLATSGNEVQIYLQFRDGRYEAFNKHADETKYQSFARDRLASNFSFHNLTTMNTE